MLNVSTKNLQNITVICAQGQIVNGDTAILRSAVNSLPDTRVVVLDVARVSTVDAHGLGVLLELRAQLQTKGVRFEIMNVNRQLRRILEITRLDSVFNITSGVEFFPASSPGQRVPLSALKSCA
jgi:anti-sigma B factor antagonist